MSLIILSLPEIQYSGLPYSVDMMQKNRQGLSLRDQISGGLPFTSHLIYFFSNYKVCFFPLSNTIVNL